MSVLVLTVDQRSSRLGADRVPHALRALAGVRALLPFERTVGDELQGVLDDPTAVPVAVETLLRDGAWNIGIGVGEIDRPTPASARAGRGPAYLHARDAVSAAKSSPWHLRVVGDEQESRDLESTLWLWATLLARRTVKGWEVADLVDAGLSYEETGRRLGITQSAVSQRAQAAGLVECQRARELTAHLAARLIGQDG